MRSRAAALGVALASLVLTAPTAQAQQSAPTSAGDCDTTWVAVPYYFDSVDSASFSKYGRHLTVWNESIRDDYTYAEIDSGYQSGDQVWIDRSLTTKPLNPVHPSDGQVGDWKQCGPFNRSYSDYVKSWHYAIRGCMRPKGGASVCGPWNVDQAH